METYKSLVDEKNLNMEEAWAKYCSLWRSKPDLFIDFILPADSKFKLFFYQRVMLRATFRNRICFYTFTRGTSKSFMQILALYLKCIMYPSIKLTITAPQKQMASAISQQNIESIWEFMPILKNEVRHIQFAKDYTRLIFLNGSSLDIVALAESTRGMRRHGISVEEVIFDGFDEETFNSVLLPIMANNRLTKHGEDPNELHKPLIFVTTAGNRQSFGFKKVMEVLTDMIEGKSSFYLGSSYELPTMHNLLSIDYINDLKMSPNFNALAFMREYESVWTGSSEGSLVDLEDFKKGRVLTTAESKAVDKNAEYILSYDVARAEGSANASSALVVFKIIDRGDGTYQKHVVNIYSFEGTHFREQAIFLKRKVAEYSARMLVIDSNGLGAGLVDQLVLEIDENPPYSIVNDDRYDKYKTENSIPMVFSIKSQSKDTNSSDIHNIFMRMINNNQVKFLIAESQAKVKFRKRDSEEQLKVLAPFIQTDMLQEEIMNLEYKMQGNKTSVKQISKGINKDRFSALEYGLFYIHTLEKANKIRREENVDLSSFFFGRQAKSGL